MNDKIVTIYDVAKRANVSNQTVSRVINTPDKVSSKTRLIVEQAIQELNYVPNIIAQNLAKKHGQTIGIITSKLLFHSQAMIMSGINQTARQLNFDVIVNTIDVLDFSHCQKAIMTLKSQRVAGIIVSVPVLDDEFSHFDQLLTDLPHLYLAIIPQHSRHYVVNDIERGAAIAAEHLIALGHRKIAYIAGPKTSISSILGINGWLSVFHRHNLTPVFTGIGDWTACSGHQITTELLNHGIDFSAILVGNDQMSLGVLNALYQHGLQVPHDVSVIGFDNEEDSQYFIPPLTTIKQDFFQMGQEALQRLVKVITQKSRHIDSLILEPMLVKRASTDQFNTHRVALKNKILQNIMQLKDDITHL